MKKLISILSGLLLVFVFVTIAKADSVSVDFENPPYVLGNINGQDGWTKTGGYDVNVVSNTFEFSTYGSQSLQISDAVTSGSFSDQTFSKSLIDEAGETDALNGGYSGGVRQNHFEAQFDIASTMLTQQSGMHLSVSPDRGDGARMSYLRFEDSTNGINVFFEDVQGTTNPANFVETQVGSDLNRAVPHTIKFVMDFVDGPSNDIVKIYIDGILVHTGTSWENYYRFDSESNPSLISNSRTVDTLLFRESGAANPTDLGHGYIIDNLSLLSSTIIPDSQQTAIYHVDGGSSDYVTNNPYNGHVTLVTPDGKNSLMIQGVIQGLQSSKTYYVWVRDLTGYTGVFLNSYTPLGYYALTSFTTNRNGAGNFSYKINGLKLPAGTYHIQVAINFANSQADIGYTVAATQKYTTVVVGN